MRTAHDQPDLLFRALADRTRLRLVHLLSQRAELCVCELMAVLDLPQARVSRHLAYLRRAGFVAGRRDQQWMHYRLLPPRSKAHAGVLECLQACAAEFPMLQGDRRRLAKRSAATGCPPTLDCCGPTPRRSK